MDLTSLKVTATEGACKMTETQAGGEEAVKKFITEFEKLEFTGTIGGWYEDADQTKGLFSQKSVTFDYSDDAGAFALSMAGALVTAALAF